MYRYGHLNHVPYLSSETDKEDGGVFTGGTTGDSGFSDAAEFLKVDLADSREEQTIPMASYYKSLHANGVGVPSYYKGSREETQKFHG